MPVSRLETIGNDDFTIGNDDFTIELTVSESETIGNDGFAIVLCHFSSATSPCLFETLRGLQFGP